MFPVAGASWRPGLSCFSFMGWRNGEFWLMLRLILLLVGPPKTSMAQPRELGSPQFGVGAPRAGLGVWGGKFGFGTRMFVALSPLLEETWQKGKERLRSAALPLRNLCLRLGPFGCASAPGDPQNGRSPQFHPLCAWIPMGTPWTPAPDPIQLCCARRAHAGGLIGW